MNDNTKQNDDSRSLALIIRNSADDFESELNLYDFLVISTIFAAEEGAFKKIQKAVINRKDKFDSWPKEKKAKTLMRSRIENTCQAVCDFASENIEDNFSYLGRQMIVSLCAAFERRVKVMLFVSHAVRLKSIKNGEINSNKSDIFSKIQLREIEKNIQTSWDIARDLRSNTSFKEMLIDLASRLHVDILFGSEDLFYYDYFKTKDLYLNHVIKEISEDCWIGVEDAFLLRNSIAHNRNISKQQISIGKQQFVFNEEIDPAESAVRNIINYFRKINDLFPSNPNKSF